MTREELRDYVDEQRTLNNIPYHVYSALIDGIDTLEQEPCEDIAQERYKDLCEYFGNAKDILKSREDFKAWLGRVKWHIRKAEELYEKYEYKQEPKTGHWIEVTNGRGGHECNICHEYAPSYQSGAEYLAKYCPNCGARMESEDKE